VRGNAGRSVSFGEGIHQLLKGQEDGAGSSGVMANIFPPILKRDRAPLNLLGCREEAEFADDSTVFMAVNGEISCLRSDGRRSVFPLRRAGCSQSLPANGG